MNQCPRQSPKCYLPNVKRVICVFAVLCGLVAGNGGSQVLESDDSLRVVTLNIHYLSVRNDRTDWERRAPSVVAALESIDADLIAFQEMETFGAGRGGPHFSDANLQLDYVLAEMPHYQPAAVGDPAHYPSTQPILYKPDRLVPLDQGFFFFSPESDEIYSRPWHARFPAFASWVRFEELGSGRRFMVYNVHFDVTSFRNRTKSARLVVEREGESAYSEDPVLILGDFNAFRFMRTMGILRRAGFARAGANGPTFHFRRGINLLPAIDHILGSAEVELSEATVHRNRFLDEFPSDHHPVSALVRFE